MGSRDFTYLRGIVCLPGSVHRDDEQLESAPRFYENCEFVQPEKKGTSKWPVGFSVVGGLLLAGFAFSRLRARKGAEKDVLKLFS